MMEKVEKNTNNKSSLKKNAIGNTVLCCDGQSRKRNVSDIALFFCCYWQHCAVL